MLNAADRAEARRKAILAKRGDRLAKLTTTARGDEGKTYLSDDGPSFSKAFLGDEATSDMPTPPRASVSPSPASTPNKSTVTSSSTAPSSIPTSFVKPETLFNEVDESVWSPELQEQFRQALLSANPPRSNAPSRVASGASASAPDPSTEQLENDPLAELLASLGGGAGAGQPTGTNMFELLQTMRNGPQALTPEAQTPKRDKAFRNLIQLVSTWLLLAYFVFFLEPAAYKERVGSLDVGRWSRWAVLGENRNMLELLSTFKVQPQPAFFWAFVALQAAVHFNSIRNTLIPSVKAPSPLAALGPLARIPSLFSLGLLFLNGLGGITFGLGFIVFLAGYASTK